MRTSRKRSKSPGGAASVFTRCCSSTTSPNGASGPSIKPHDVPDQDLLRRPPQAVAALAATLARDDARVLEGQQDPLEELLGDPLLLGDGAGRHEPALVGLGQVDERLEA